MKEERRKQLIEIIEQLKQECLADAPQIDEIIIRYTGKLAVLREQWKTEDRLKARQA